MKQQHAQQDENRIEIVSEEYGGKWIAWNHDATRILASGDDATHVKTSAIAAGENDPILEWVPPSDAFLVGNI